MEAFIPKFIDIFNIANALFFPCPALKSKPEKKPEKAFYMNSKLKS